MLVTADIIAIATGSTLIVAPANVDYDWSVLLFNSFINVYLHILQYFHSLLWFSHFFLFYIWIPLISVLFGWRILSYLMFTKSEYIFLLLNIIKNFIIKHAQCATQGDWTRNCILRKQITKPWLNLLTYFIGNFKIKTEFLFFKNWTRDWTTDYTMHL